MQIIKQLKKNFTYLLCNYFDGAKYDFKHEVEIKGTTNIEDQTSFEGLKSKISELLANKVVKDNLKDNLEEKIKLKLENGLKTKDDLNTLSVIYNELVKIQENGDFLDKEKKKAEKNNKLKEKLNYAKIAGYQEHLEAVLQAEDLICEALGQCEGVEKAREEVMKESKEKREQLIKELGDRLNKTLLEKNEKYKDNSEVLEKIKKLEGELGDIIKEYLEEINNDNISEEQKAIAIEMFREKIGKLEIALKIIEADEEKERRYEGIEEEYNKVKEVEEFKDIIGEKKFDELTAGDFYAMLRTNPEKVRNLLLATSNGETVNIAGNWEAYKNKVLKVNFGKNKGLDKIVGAGDILDIYNVKLVKINGVKGIRKASPRPGYYSVKDGHYLAIHDGYTIEITDTTKLEGKEKDEFKKSVKKRFDDIRGAEIKKSLSSDIKEQIAKNKNAKEIVLPENYRSKVDVNFIKELIIKPENEYLGLQIDEEKNTLTVGEGFNIGHLGEALNGYSETKAKITKYLSEHKDLSKDTEIDLNIDELGLDKNEEFIKGALEVIVGNYSKKGEKVLINVDDGNINIISQDEKRTIGDIFSTGYEYKGNSHTHEKYRSEIVDTAQKYGVPEGAIIQLIYHENGTWNPRIKAPGSSAYGLGQMINSTWNRFGRGLDRNNPGNQLMATANYMKHIKNTKNCSWEEVLAYYNTGLGIRKVGNINKYYNLNPAIARKQPAGEPRTNTNYFIAAVAYYNDIDFSTARTKLKTM